MTLKSVIKKYCSKCQVNLSERRFKEHEAKCVLPFFQAHKKILDRDYIYSCMLCKRWSGHSNQAKRHR